MVKAISGAGRIPPQTLCEGHNSTGTSDTSKENQIRKRIDSLQF